jgi:hypothetical protein
MSWYTITLASNFSGIENLVLGIPLVLIALAGVSFIFSAQGHWMSVALAAPAVGIGVLMFLSVAMARAPFFFLLLTLLPVGMGMASLAMWREKRNGGLG